MRGILGCPTGGHAGGDCGYITCMSEESPDQTPHPRPTESQARVPPPPRPPLSNPVPPPIPPPMTATGAARVSKLLWLTSFAAGLMAIVFAFLARDAQVERLKEIVTDIRPDQDAASLEAVASVVFWGTLGALALVIAVEALLVRVMMRRRRWPRWVLMPVLLLHGAVALLADGFVVLPEEGVYVGALLAAQLLLALAGLVVSFLPGAGAWLRAENQPRRRPRA